MLAPRRSVGPAVRLVLLLLFLAGWGGWFIYRTSFEVAGRRYFVLFDDAMISMTYARNLVEGHGFNWARWGEPVEGYTHPLWTLVMIPVNVLPVPLRDRSLLVQLLSLVLLAATVVAVRRLTLAHFSAERACHWLPAAVLTATYYPLLYWSLLGMETGLQALLAVLAVHLALSAVHGGRDHHLALWLVCAAAYLLRMDMILLVVAVQVYVVARGGLRRAGRASWVAGLAVFVAAGLAYSVFRWFYFHDVLPNTYYLKLAGVPLAVRVLRGLTFLTAFLRDHLLLLVPVGVGTAILARRSSRVVLPAAVFVLFAAYDVYIGGDAWDGDIPLRANRFIAFVMPLVFVLFNAVLNAAVASWRRNRREPADSPAGSFAVSLATAAAVLIVNGLWLSDRADVNWRAYLAIARPPAVERHERVTAGLHAFERIVLPGATVACAWAGIPAYFTDHRMIDILGYNDRWVAHLAPVTPLSEKNFADYRPGHVKWDQDRLLRVQRPDAFFQTWGIRRGMGKIAELLPGYGYRRVRGFWVRADSPYIRDLRAASDHSLRSIAVPSRP